MMKVQFSYILIPLLVAGLLGILSSWYLLNRRKAKGSIPLALLFISISIWSFSYALESLFTDYAIKVIWAKIVYFGKVSVPIFWLLFCLVYANKRNLKKIELFFLSMVPLITLALVWTNSTHHLIWRKPVVIDLYGLKLLQVEYGIWFWIHALYSHSLFLAGMYFLIPQGSRISYTLADLIPCQ
jgi:hypothetical protein